MELSVFRAGVLCANRYRLVDKVGRGGFSVVWKAQDEKKNMPVVVKIYLPDKGADDELLDLFKHEYELTCNLSDPRLVTCTDYFVHEDSPCLVMPYCSGGSLHKQLYENPKTGQFSERDLAKVIYQVCGALHYLHSQKPSVLHLDIKPENILVDYTGNYLLADFGISLKTRNSMVKTANMLGATFPYTAPEKSELHKLTKKSDIFSLGVVIYELCTRELPWNAESGLALLKGAPLPLLPDIYSTRLQKIMHACMQRHADDRPTARQLEEIARNYLNNDYWDEISISGKTAASALIDPTKLDEYVKLYNGKLSGKTRSQIYKTIAGNQGSIDKKIFDTELNAAINRYKYSKQVKRPPDNSDRSDTEDNTEGTNRNKKIKKRVFFSILALAVVAGVTSMVYKISQGGNRAENLKNKADGFFSANNYDSAMFYYNKASEISKNDTSIKNKIIKTSFKLNTAGFDGVFPLFENRAMVSQKEIVSSVDRFGKSHKSERTKYGYVDRYGKLKISVSFDTAGNFSDAIKYLAVVGDENGNFGFIDTNGKIKIPCIYKELSKIDDTSAWFSKGNEKYGIVAKSGKEYELKCKGKFINGTAIVYKKNKFGLVDCRCDTVIKPQYNKMVRVKDLFWVRKNNKYGYVDKKDSVIIPIIYEDLSVGYFFQDNSNNLSYFAAQKGNYYGLIDRKNKTIIPFICDFYPEAIFDDYYRGFIIRSDLKYGFYNLYGNKIIPQVYEQMGWNNETHWLWVKKYDNRCSCNKWGSFNDYGSERIPVIYEDKNLEYISELGYWKTYKDGNYGCIDNYNQIKIHFIYKTLSYNKLIKAFWVEDMSGKNFFIDRNGVRLEKKIIK